MRLNQSSNKGQRTAPKPTTANYSSTAGGSTTTINVTTFAYDMAFILGFVMLVVLIILASYLGGRDRCRLPPPPSHPSVVTPQTAFSGINEATLLTYPKILYSCAKVEHNGNALLSCSICLGDYKETDSVRLLPNCGHFFHTQCVNPWLRLNPTCPICRKLQSGERAI